MSRFGFRPKWYTAGTSEYKELLAQMDAQLYRKIEPLATQAQESSDLIPHVIHKIVEEDHMLRYPIAKVRNENIEAVAKALDAYVGISDNFFVLHKGKTTTTKPAMTIVTKTPRDRHPMIEPEPVGYSRTLGSANEGVECSSVASPELLHRRHERTIINLVIDKEPPVPELPRSRHQIHPCSHVRARCIVHKLRRLRKHSERLLRHPHENTR